MSARWEERRDGRSAGRADAGEGAGPACVALFAFLVFAAVYMVVQVLLWVIP